MSEIPLYGLGNVAKGSDPYLYIRVIFAASRGTLMELGIGPIVTAGLILQLLAGPGIINVDFSKPEDRSLFNGATKVFGVVIAIVQALSYLVGGAYGSLSLQVMFMIFLQLVTATIIVMLLDEVLQKGWGLGSGISLFILAGVAQKVVWECFAPIPMGDGKYYGAILAFIQSIINQENLWTVFTRSGGLPSILSFILTILAFLIVIYIQDIRVELPIAYAQYRGFRGRYPVNLLYVSNIPVIIASAIFANIYLFSQIIWSRFNSDNANLWLNIFGTYNASNPSAGPTGGFAYYIISPRGLEDVLHDPIRALIYALLMITICALFSVVWIDISGMDSKSVAKQLVNAGLQIPGFRRSEGAIQTILEKYIPTLALLGGLIVGALSVVTDFFGVFGTGMGILLAVSILYQYYEILVRESAAELYPTLRFFLGRR
jgi:preprotein translocase SecY subunit